MGDFDHALADLDEAIRLKPGEEVPYFRRCRVYRAKGDIDRAITDCEETVRLDPKQTNAMELTAKMRFERGDLDRAAELFSKLLERYPSSIEPLFYRGQILLFRQNRPAEAADDLARAAKEAFDYRRLGDSFAEQAGSNARDLMAFEHPFLPDGLYLVIWTHIARARAGQDDKEERGEHFVKLGARDITFSMWMTYDKVTKEVEQFLLAPWPGAIFGLFLGKTTPEAVRAAAESPADPEVRSKRICDADFYTAEYFLETGAADEARKLLAAAANGCPPTAREAGFAAAELKRVGP
jgi:tetratricopeptide (TPR) repeat protein